MRALAIVHERDAGPGVFIEAINAAGFEMDQWFRAEAASPPAEPSGYDAVLTFGGSMHPYQEQRHPWIREEKALLAALVERGVPTLGVCLGAQLLAEAAGGTAQRAAQPEIGWFEVEVTSQGADDAVLRPLAPHFEAFGWHSYEFQLPPGAVTLARTPICPQAYRIGESVWGIQFHAEVTGADVERWINDYRDEDAERIGLDRVSLLAETRPKMPQWNELGRELCGRFLTAVQARVA
jgi:GMP synthase (glutamine-hydrolysing)